ncbi:hypothetical protein D3C81_1669970 [compost metagenome]
MKNTVHVVHCLAVTQATAPAQVGQHVRAPAHGLGATGNGYPVVAEQDALRRTDYGLQAGTAQAIDVESRCFQGDPCVNGGHSGEVRVTRLGGHHITHDHVANWAAVDTGVC